VILKENNKNMLPPIPKKTKKMKKRKFEAGSLNQIIIESDPIKIEEQKLKFKCMSQQSKLRLIRFQHK